MNEREAVDVSWTVNALRLSGLSWGRPEQSPLLMLHGWLDNAASFALIAPLLEDFYVVAIDLTGHGQSDRRSADASYQIWDDLPEIMGVADQLGWDTFDLLGHSRGANISGMLASAFPERIRHLVLLDAISPEAVSEQLFPEQMRKFLDQKPELLGAKNRVFDSLEEAARQREKGGLSAAAAGLLAERGVEVCEGGLTWTTDRRLHGASAVKLTQGQNQAVLDHLTMPTLLLLAEGGRVATNTDFQALERRPGFQLETIPGGHHFHMEPPLASLADRIGFFLQEKSE
ncbi:MAG: alpha/beta hydrolase [Halioglobus sp.]